MNKKILNYVCDVSVISLQNIKSDKGEMSILDNSLNCPFKISRVFNIKSRGGNIRGNHAHKNCNQILVCLEGKIKIKCKDTRNQKSFTLDKMDKAILIPKHIWSSQEYLEDINVLMVACDLSYNEKDYIRNYKDFEYFRNNFI